MSDHSYEMAWREPPRSGERYRVEPEDANYLRLCSEEAAYYATPRPFHTDLQAEDGPVVRHANARMTGDPRIAWFETLQHHGAFRRGLQLGSGGHEVTRTILGMNPALHLTVCDVSSEAVEERVTLAAEFPGRVDGLVADLNFHEWERESYDFIVSDSTLHHVINIEHVAEQANLALLEGGYLFIADYVGETRFEWSDAKRRVYEAFIRKSYVAATGADCRMVFDEQRLKTSPLCGVRSIDTIDVLGRALEPVAVRQTNALAPLVLSSRAEALGPWRKLGALAALRARIAGRIARLRARFDPAARSPFGARFLRDLFFLDDLVTDAGLLTPCNAFAVYRKRR